MSTQEIEILAKQREFLQATEDVVIFRGAIRSGKLLSAQ